MNYAVTKGSTTDNFQNIGCQQPICLKEVRYEFVVALPKMWTALGFLIWSTAEDMDSANIREISES